MPVTAYLDFKGRCEEALDFYKAAVDAQVNMLMRFSQMPPGNGPTPPAAIGDKVMHAAFTVGGSEINASDGMMSDGTPAQFQGFMLSLRVPDEATARAKFAALAEGGTVRQAPTATFFSPCFGMLTDKFGVGWMVLVLD